MEEIVRVPVPEWLHNLIGFVYLVFYFLLAVVFAIAADSILGHILGGFFSILLGYGLYSFISVSIKTIIEKEIEINYNDFVRIY